MNIKIKITGLGILFSLLIFTTCKDPEGLYKEYLVPNGLIYPAKALNAEAHPGRERIEIAWLNGVQPSVVKARIFWNNYTDSIDVAIDPGKEVITKEIKPLAENSYMFMIRTYDAAGNGSVPVEVIGEVYGEMYRNSLVNRAMKSAVYNTDETSLRVEWSAATDITEVGINLSYTDINGAKRTRLIYPSEISATIRDFKAGEPVFYNTVYKPDSLAIDNFETPKVQIPYYAEITAAVLKNYQKPFSYHGTPSFSGDYFKGLDNWVVNPAGEGNGNALAQPDGRLFIGIYPGAFPAPEITNGKLYQSVELEAGTYRFDIFVNYSMGNPVVYLTAAIGNGLPDTNDVEQRALAYSVCPQQTVSPVVTPAKGSTEFVLKEKSVVSLGFVTTLSSAIQLMYIDGVALWKQF